MSVEVVELSTRKSWFKFTPTLWMLQGYKESSELLTYLVLHPELDESRGHQHRSSAQPGHTVDSNAGVRVGLELPIDETQPLVHDLLCRGGPVREAQLGHGDLLLLQLLRVVEFVSGAHEVGDLVLLQQSDVVVHSPVLTENISVQCKINMKL